MSLKSDIKNSFVWNAIENLSRTCIQFVIGVILARLLEASDYGILGILSVFIAISQTLIDAGFSNALLQKEECTKEDYNTVYWVNVCIASVIFIVLFFTAPLIGRFYESSIMASTLKVMSVSIVIQSLYTVHKVRLTKSLKFKYLAYVAFLSTIISGIVSISLAYFGLGVWALIVQSVLSVVISGLLIIAKDRWLPRFQFSKHSFKRLFGFGSKLLVSNLLYTIFNNIYNLVIGKCFSANILGYFTRADGYAKLIPNNISGILQNIMLPVLSRSQKDDDVLLNSYYKFARITSYCIIPLSLLFCALARPLIILMLTEKWAPSIPILQVLCIASLLDHLMTINNNYLMVKGKSDYILKISILSKLFLILALAISFKFGIIAVAWSKFAYGILIFCISAYYIRKTFKIGITSVIKSIIPIYLLALLLAYGAWELSKFMPIALWSIAIISISYIGLYYLISRLILKEEINILLSIAKRQA